MHRLTSYVFNSCKSVRNKERCYFRFLALKTLLILCLKTNAQELDNYNFYNVSEGLSHKRVHTIAQDDDGFIWIGTYGGLNRYNGIEFDIYENGEDPYSLPGDDVSDLLTDVNGNLWVGTNNGLAKYSKLQDNFQIFKKETHHNLSSNAIQEIAQAENNTLWIATDQGVCYYRDRQFTRIKSIPPVLIRTISIDNDGNVWAGTNEEIYVITQNDNLVSVLSDIFESTYEVTSSEVDIQGNVWLGTRMNGLIRVSNFQTADEEIRLFSSEAGPQSLSSDQILHLNKDKDGYLWVSTENGLNRFDPTTNTFQILKSNPNDLKSISGNNIWTSYKDRAGRLWVSAFNQGIDVYDPKREKFVTVNQNSIDVNGLSNNNVTCFHVDKDGTVWIGTDGGGINIWDLSKGVFVKKRIDNSSIGSDAVLDLREDASGNIWVATWAGGLTKYNRNNNTFTRYSTQKENSITNNNVFEIEEDDQGNLWVGTFGGINVLNKDGERILHIANSLIAEKALSSNEVLSVLVDGSTAWVGTLNGLNQIKFEEDYTYNLVKFYNDKQDPRSITSNIINDIYKDKNGAVWFATKGGLSRWNGENEFINYTKKDGLPSKEIMSIFETSPGSYWITTIKGVANLEFKKNTIFKNILFTKSDGLQSDNFLRGSYGISTDGTVYIGGTKGFNYFDQEKIKANNELATVFFTDFKISNKSFDLIKSEKALASIMNAPAITLNRFDNIITVEFIGLSYTQTEKNQYAYKLEGFEDNWNYVGTQRFATYTNLDPREYRLLVKATNNDQVWNETYSSLNITMMPAWWATWWFRMLIIILVASAIFVFSQWRIKSIRFQKEELKRKIEEATAQVSAQNQILKDEQLNLANAIAETNHVVSLAVESGDFSGRIQLENKAGEWRQLGQSINELFESIMLPFDALTEIVGAMATSNISMRYEHEAKGDIFKLASSLNYALDNLSDLLSSVIQNMYEIGISSEEMLISGQEMKVGTGEIATSTSELSRGAQEQVTRIDEASHILENVIEAFSDVSSQARSINDAAEEGAVISDEGKSQMNTMDKSMKQMSEASKAANHAISSLSEKSTNITGMLGSIKEIAVETNMLALNAAIEAAKAGDAGRGFAVVADQIRKLAENSNHFAVEIENIISEVQNNIQNTHQLIGDMSQDIKGSVKASETASGSFDRLATSYAVTLGMSNQILEHSKEQHNKVKEVVQLIENVVVIAEQAAAGTEEIASSSNELSTGMTEYTEKSAKVSEIIKTLNEKMQQFKLR